MNFFTSLLRRLTRHYLVKHTSKGWVLLHFHSWDHSTLIIKTIPYTTQLIEVPPGFKLTQFHLPCTTSTTSPAPQLSSLPIPPLTRESRFPQKM